MQTVYLNGGIEKFGSKWSTDCNNIRDIFKLIECQTPGFRQYLVDAADSGVNFEIQRGKEILEDADQLLLSLRDEDIIITEVPAGSKDGVTKILAAIAIVTVMFMAPGNFFFTAGGAITTPGMIAATLAINLAIGGLTQVMAPGPETDEESGQNEGYLFNGPVTNTPQGLPVPVLYGELIVGGKPISAAYRSASPFANKNDVMREDSYLDPTTGAILTNGRVEGIEDPNGGYPVPPSDPQGIPIEESPSTHPDPREEEQQWQDDAAQYDEYSRDSIRGR